MAYRKILFFIAAVACLSPFVTSPIALIGGLLFAHFIGHPYLELNHKAVKLLLKVAIVGLGFGMNINKTLATGKDGFFLTAAFIFSTLALGIFLGKVYGVNKKTTHLISSGTAICGGSAIAAMSPVINASEKSISIALGVVFLLNSVALLVFPPIGHYFALTEHQFGLWAAIAIHDTSSVVGAALAYGEEALEVATTVKLTRALWIIPLSIISMFLYKGKSNKIKIPWFIFLFIFAILVNSYLPLPEILTIYIPYFSKSVLVLTLFLIGAGLSVDKIKSAGWKPMLLGLSLWIIVSITSLVIIRML
jgi:uncharacterized integral membrane protein (TIGR00698 family)